MDALDLVDIGVNFHSSQLAGNEDELIERARAAGVATMLATGTSLEASRLELGLASRHPGVVFATAGVHPHAASQWPGGAAFEPLWADARVVAVGECGLDYHRMFSPQDAQRAAFAAQLEAAARIGKPVFLHCRDAFDDFHAMMREACAAGVRGVVHCFTDGAAQAEALLALGLEIGVTGWVTDAARGQALREAVRFVPLAAMHLETDAPYLRPKNAGKTRPYNEPANLPWVALAVAELKGVTADEAGAACAANSRRLFGLSRPA